MTRPSYFRSAGCIASPARGKEGLATLARFSCALEEFAKVQWGASCHVTYLIINRWYEYLHARLWQRRTETMADASFGAITIENAVNKAVIEMGYDALRDKQREAILGFLQGRDVFVSLPTGGGKSLCYSVLPKVFDILRKKRYKSVVIVISPLISLMKDQIQSLRTKGIKSTFVSKDLADSDDDVEQALYEGTYQIIFFSPETLLCDDTWKEMMQTQVYKDNVVAFVIDEAHLVKKW